MDIQQLGISGAWVLTPRLLADERGSFHEWFRRTGFRDAVGRSLDVAQANCSVSARGVLRGIHYADVPPGQGKYITCAAGAILDVIVDIRVGSPTFGRWESVLLDAQDRRAVYLAEGLGHAFCSLEEGSTVMYLCTTEYAPTREHEIHPLDPALGIQWSVPVAELTLSPKDAAAPTLAEAAAAGLLPTWEACQALDRAQG